MSAYKHWRIYYSIQYIDGSVEKVSFGSGGLDIPTVKARTIQGALKLAEENVVKPLRMDRDIRDVVIWNISIVEDDVFGDR
ncbi:MAG: hypothetical protein K6A77_11610 [Clostridiales bacterium]|nr:hypothetical protein [Clostridiales bacterium]